MPNYYAQISMNGSNKVIGLSQLSGPVSNGSMVPITEAQYANDSLFSYRYVNGNFIPPMSIMSADKTVIAADGQDTVTIKLDLSDAEEFPRFADGDEDVIVEVNGLRQVVKGTDGIAVLTLTSEEPGEYFVRTVNLESEETLKVVVTDDR
ncbi:Ig-like domain-containing protein [Paenibacillus kobensis]|uniref:invasin domain 3-containing protein n=1 Tax=Paenibacillus kobensis TaxID=59841 RepID=UPI000FDC2DBE|nr:invasin domain 3-containing protein [Paenibacillus kobensis]